MKCQTPVIGRITLTQTEGEPAGNGDRAWVVSVETLSYYYLIYRQQWKRQSWENLKIEPCRYFTTD